MPCRWWQAGGSTADAITTLLLPTVRYRLSWVDPASPLSQIFFKAGLHGPLGLDFFWLGEWRPNGPAWSITIKKLFLLGPKKFVRINFVASLEWVANGSCQCWALTKSRPSALFLTHVFFVSAEPIEQVFSGICHHRLVTTYNLSEYYISVVAYHWQDNVHVFYACWDFSRTLRLPGMIRSMLRTSGYFHCWQLDYVSKMSVVS
jgi:hypothetical protein